MGFVFPLAGRMFAGFEPRCSLVGWDCRIVCAGQFFACWSFGVLGFLGYASSADVVHLGRGGFLDIKIGSDLKEDIRDGESH